MADINPVLVKDKRINQITDQVDYGVYSGASQNTFQQFNATTASASNISFNVQVPSENIIVDRNVFISSKVNFTVAMSGSTGNVPFNIGQNDALQAFPLNKLFTTSSCTINNTNVSTNTADVIDCLLKQISVEDLQKYEGMCPTFPDGAYKLFTDSQSTANGPLNGYKLSSYNNLNTSRGSYPITVNGFWRSAGGTITKDLTTTANTDVVYFNCSVNLTEPLIGLSPFLFGGDNQYNGQGLVGINSMNFVFNIDSTCKRFWSHSNWNNAVSGNWTYNVSLGNMSATTTSGAVVVGTSLPAFQDTNLLFNFLSSQPTDLINSKNVVAISDFPRYILTNNTSSLNANSTATVTCQNVQLNQIPDRLFIFVRKQLSQQDTRDSATFFPIKNISVNFSNASGLLSSATQQDLYQMSVANGLNMNWVEWSGYAGSFLANTYSGTIAVGNFKVPTCGSILVLNPAKDLSLPSYLSNGSIGAFSLQFNITVENNTATTTPIEVVLVSQNSGVFVTQSGSSSIYTGLLTKQMVLDASASPALDSGELDRLVGGLNMSSAMKNVPHSKKKMAGVMSAGVRSAGMAMRKLDAMAM